MVQLNQDSFSRTVGYSVSILLPIRYTTCHPQSDIVAQIAHTADSAPETPRQGGREEAKSAALRLIL